LARELDISTITARCRLDALFSGGALHMHTDIAPALHGQRVEALMWLQVSPDMIEIVGIAVGQHPAVRLCVALTGTAQLMLDCLAPNEQALYGFLTRDLADLGVDSIAGISIVLVTLRRTPAEVAHV
jgi:hypothetical protein